MPQPLRSGWGTLTENMFGNWTPDRVQRSQMLIKCWNNQSSIIYWMDVLDDGKFTTPDMTVTPTKDSENDFGPQCCRERRVSFLPCILVWLAWRYLRAGEMVNLVR